MGTRQEHLSDRSPGHVIARLLASIWARCQTQGVRREARQGCGLRPKAKRTRPLSGGDGFGHEYSACLWVSGPTRKMPPSASAVDFFQLFVPDNVLKNMVVQTNMYARKFQERFGSDGAWVEVTLAEMKAFLGYVISTSVSHCESVLSIWSGGFYSNRSLALVMSQARFEKILKYFHVVAFRSSQTTHGLYKVQPFLDSLQSGFDAAFRPSQTQVRSCVCTCMYVFPHTGPCMQMCLCMCMCVYTCVICVCVCMCTCIHVCVPGVIEYLRLLAQERI